MTSRERLAAALAHREPDRVPLDLGTMDTTIAHEVYVGVARGLGLEPAIAAPHPAASITPDEAVLEALGADIRLAAVPPRPECAGGPLNEPPPREEHLADGAVQWTHADGRVYQRAAGHWDVQLRHPAIRGALTEAEIARLFPAGAAAGDWADAAAARAAIAAHHARGKPVQCNFIIMPVTGTSTGPLDFTSWCAELATDPARLGRLMDRFLERWFALAESFYAAVGAAADLVYALGDDVASHAALWMSPADYRQHVKPRHAAIVRFVKARTRARIIHHCCGACRAIIPDLIEIGVDVLNPTQTSAAGMDPFALKRDFGKDLAFWGGLDVIHLLPRGTPRQVEDEVKRHIDALAPGGGYVLAPSHMIPRGTPPENVLAMYRTAQSYGRR